MQMSNEELIGNLLQWCSDHGIIIDPRLEVQPDAHGGIGVFTGAQNIPQGVTVVSIPKESVLSVRSCTASDFIPPAYSGPEAQLALSAALYTELALGPRSKWYGYLRSLPTRFDLPICWDVWVNGKAKQPSHVLANDMQDMADALSWMRGTEAEKILRRNQCESNVTFEVLKIYFQKTLVPLLKRHLPFPREMDETVELNRYLHAFALVSSRSFLVDAYHGLAMVPIADAFNHVLENHVHMQTEYHVCPECGSLDECQHDRNDDDHPESASRKNNVANDDSYEMVTNTSIPAFSEVYNTYGETLSNAKLFCQHGFVLEANDNDILSWTEDEIFGALAGMSTSAWETSKPLCSSLLKNFEFVRGLEDIQFLVGHSNSSGDVPYYINADGQVSVGLWILISLSCAHQVDDVASPAVFEENQAKTALQSLHQLQVALESQLEAQVCSDDDAMDNGSPGELLGTVDEGCLAVFRRTCELLVGLCQRRKVNTGREADDDELADYLDTLDSGKWRTKAALLLAMNERAILSSCEATWTELLDLSRGHAH